MVWQGYSRHFLGFANSLIRNLNFLSSGIASFATHHPHPSSLHVDHWIGGSVYIVLQVSFQSYFDFVGHHQLLNPFLSKDKQSILLMWTWSIPVELKQKAEDFVVDLRGFIFSIDEFAGEGAMEVKLTGNIILDHEMKAETKF